MEADKNVIWVESPEEIKERLTADINSVHSDLHGIVIISKGRIVSCNTPIRDFFDIARTQEIIGLDISLLIPPDILDGKMLNHYESPGMYYKKGAFTDYMGMPSETWLVSFDVTSGNFLYKVIVFQNLALKTHYSHYFSQMLQNILTNVHTFISEIQQMPEEKQMLARMLEHIALLSRANLLYYSAVSYNGKMVIRHFLNNDPKYQKTTPLFESIIGLQMPPSDEAIQFFQTGKVHESPLDINKLTFNSLDPIQIEKISSALRLAKIYSVSIIHNKTILGVFTLIYDQLPEFFYHSAIELYLQSVSPLIAAVRNQSKWSVESQIMNITGNNIVPAALVNEREVILNCNDLFISFLKYDNRNELIGKSTREISDRVEFDNYLTNIYMRKKKISGIYPSVLIDKFKNPVPVTIFAGPCFEKDKFTGAFGLFVQSDHSKTKINDSSILPQGFSMPYVVCDFKGQIVESGLNDQTTENDHIAKLFAGCNGTHSIRCEEIHGEMQKESLYLTVIKCPDHNHITIFRLCDTKKELFIYLLNPSPDHFLFSQNRIFPEILDKADIGIMITDTVTGNIEYVNSSYESLSGFTAAEVRDRPHFSFFKHNEELKNEHDNFIRSITEGKSAEIKTFITGKNKSVIPVKINVMQIVIQKVPKNVFVITQNNEYSEKINADTTRQLNDPFPKLISEIRSPLNNLLGLCHLATEELNSSGKNKYISHIYHHTSSINKLFDEILEIHKIESGGLPVSVSEIDISSVLKSAQEKVMELLKSEKNSRLIVETFTGHPEKVKGFFSDESRIILIFELISTILIQARKSGKVSIGYKENVRKGDHSFFIRYKQDIPMSAFQPISTPAHFIFEKLDVIGEIHYRLTKLTIELLGGIYSLHNGYDYQEFAFSIPSLKKSNKKGLFNTRQFTFKGQNVLIMSAVADIKKLFTEISADADIKFDFVTDGLNALNVVRKKQYDAILLDITDDNPDGLETVWALRHKGNKTPMLAIVEQENQEIKEKCIKMGCHNFLGKPLNNQIIIHKLHRILNPEK